MTTGFVQWLLHCFKELFEIGTLSFMVLQFDLEGHCDFITKLNLFITVNKSESKIFLTSKFWKFDVYGYFKLFVRLYALVVQSERSVGIFGSIDQLQLHIHWPRCFSCILESAIDIVVGSCGPNDLSWLVKGCRLDFFIGWIKEWFKSEYFTEHALEVV